MKRIALMIAFSGIVLVNGYSQKAAQIKNLITQIAKLQVYLGYLKKGYHIVDQGLTTIGDIKKGDFTMHLTYFNSLKHVNPVVRKYGKLVEMIDRQCRIIALFRKSKEQEKYQLVFTLNETEYISTVFTSLIDKVIDDIQCVTELLTDDQYALKDDERINRLDKIYVATEEKYEFAQSFAKAIAVYAAQKQQDLNDLKVLQKLYAP